MRLIFMRTLLDAGQPRYRLRWLPSQVWQATNRKNGPLRRKRLVLLGRQWRQAMAGLRRNDDARAAFCDYLAEGVEHKRGAIEIDLGDYGWGSL
jgi:hypothetical protein